jgi:hypothetical protein
MRLRRRNKMTDVNTIGINRYVALCRTCSDVFNEARGGQDPRLPEWSRDSSEFEAETPEQALVLAQAHYQKEKESDSDYVTCCETVSIHNDNSERGLWYDQALAVWKSDDFLLFEAARSVVSAGNPDETVEAIGRLKALVAKICLAGSAHA